jgi:hypothetical protein
MWQLSENLGVHANSGESSSFVSSWTDLELGGVQANAEKHTAELIAYGGGSQARILCIDVCRQREVSLCIGKCCRSPS